MNTGLTTTPKRFFERKAFKVLAAVMAVVIIIAILLSTKVIKVGGTSNVPKLRTAKVTKGNIINSVTGSGPIEPSSSINVMPNVNGKITKIYFKEGDKVKAGDLMYELDDTNARLNVENIQNNIDQTQLQQNTNISSINSLTLTAPFQGHVSNILVKEGDDVNKNAAILTLTDNTRLKLIVPFNSYDAALIKAGQKAIVYIQNFMQSVEGTVSSVDNNSYSSTNGGQLCNVTITIDNPGSLKDDMKANADIITDAGTVSSVDNGTISSINSTVIKSLSGGTVTKVNVVENQFVNSGSVLVEFKNDELVLNTQSTDLKLKNLQQQLDSAKQQLSDYKIYAPISGTIIKHDSDLTVGSAVTQGQVLDTIVDGDHMEFTINVDELDISKIQVGQKVNVTIDALPDTTNRPLSGTVSQVALVGTSSNGVATYPVTIRIDSTDKRLRSGMNANAEILVENKTDVLVLPIEAVQRIGGRTFVMVKGDPGSSNSGNPNIGAGSGQNSNQGGRNRNEGQNGSNGNSGNRQRNGTSELGAIMRNNPIYQQYYKNAVLKPVQVGINSETYIEIIGGLNDGDEVILPPIFQSQNSNSQNNRQSGMGGMFGGFGGGAMRPPNENVGGNNNSSQRNIQRQNISGGGQGISR